MKLQIDETVPTYWIKIYMSGPIEIAKQTLRSEALREGLCVTIEPTNYIYTGGEEAGFIVGLINYPRFPKTSEYILDRANTIMLQLLKDTYQSSALLMTPDITRWVSIRKEEKK